MSAGDIAFPNLGIYLRDVPKSFSVFGFSIAYYGVIIGIGVLSGILMAAHMAKVTGQDPEDYWDFAIYAVFFSIVGARIYYVAFSWSYYRDNLLDIFKTRNGGMAIYGAVIAAFLTLFLYCRIKKKNPLLMGDTCMPGLVLGQVIGRWGNFMNREVFGEYYGGLLSMRLPVEAVRARDISENILAHMPPGAGYIDVHPTFLYESLWNLLVLTALLCFRRHKRFDGELCLLYLGGYGLGRAVIEGIRTDTLFLPGTEVPVSQVLALLMAAFAIGADVLARHRRKERKIRNNDKI